jgi:2-iminobutanoate/2-iminopropanoate deaminase
MYVAQPVNTASVQSSGVPKTRCNSFTGVKREHAARSHRHRDITGLKHSRREMAKYVIQSKRGAPPQGAYSQGWRAGEFIFVTGTGPIDPLTGKLKGDTIEEQTEQTIDNIVTILEADSASLQDVVKVTVHLSDVSLFPRYNIVYARRFSQPYPVRTTVGSDLGHSPGMLIEVDCIAYAPAKKARKSSGSGKKKADRTRR